MKFQWKQNSCALLAALIWGTAFVAQDVCSGKIEAFTFNALRCMIGVAALGIFLLIRTALRKAKVTYTPTSNKYKKTLWVGGLICGVFLCAAMNLQQTGVAESGGGKAAFITTLYIVLVPILGLFFHKKASLTLWIGVAAAVVGLYFLCIKEDFTISAGDLYLIGCAVAFTFQIMAVDYYSQKVDGIELSFIQFIFVALFSGMGAVIFEAPQITDILSCALPILYVGIFACGIAYTLQIVAQKDANATVISLIFAIESVFGMMAQALILQKFPSTRELIGCVILLAAVIIAQLPMPARKKTSL